jgi:cytochrome c556
MRHHTGTIAVCFTLFASVLASTSCSSPSPKPAEPPPAAKTPAVWSEMKPTVSVKELMRFVIDPLADNIFDAVKTEVTPKGTVETVPKTEEDWEKVRIGGVSMVETAELLKMVRPFTPPGDKNNSEGPDAVELSPEEIMAKVQKDPVEWNARIQALKNVGLATIELANKKDVAALWDASENLDEACENCHRSYWYPKENLDFYGKLDKRLRDKVTESQREGGKAPAAPKK